MKDPKDMTVEEQKDFIAQELREAVRKFEGTVISPSTEVAMKAQVYRTLKYLRNIGHLRDAGETKVQSFGSLSEEDQVRMYDAYRAWRHMSGQPLHMFAGLTGDERRWLLSEVWTAPAHVLEEIRAANDGYLDWDLVRSHPLAVCTGHIEDPWTKVLVDFDVTPMYPLHQIKLKVEVESTEGSKEE